MASGSSFLPFSKMIEHCYKFKHIKFQIVNISENFLRPNEETGVRKTLDLTGGRQIRMEEVTMKNRGQTPG